MSVQVVETYYLLQEIHTVVALVEHQQCSGRVKFRTDYQMSFFPGEAAVPMVLAFQPIR